MPDAGPKRAGMTYWTDAAILGQAGIPSVIFGPGGAGYHGLEEYVRVEDVLVWPGSPRKISNRLLCLRPCLTVKWL